MQRPPSRSSELLAEERASLAKYRITKSEHPLPPPREVKPTFVHGFFLPFALFVRVLGDRHIRGPYIKTILARTAVVILGSALAIHWGALEHLGPTTKPHVGVRNASPKPPKPPKPQAKHFEITMDDAPADDADVGDPADTEDIAKPAPPAATPTAPLKWYERAWAFVSRAWAHILALIALLSIAEAVVVFPSRRWDDWIGFHTSRLARILPEMLQPPPLKIALDVDVRWVVKRIKRKVRGYVVVFIGFPVLAPFELVPTVGHTLFTVTALLWGWYWLGVFTAAKSAHAWIDEHNALPPAPLLLLQRETPAWAIFAPVRLYARLWTALTRSIFAAVTSFERAPRAFLGLALARTILSFPLFYLLARPIMPVAAGRICAESDPLRRFDVPDHWL